MPTIGEIADALRQRGATREQADEAFSRTIGLDAVASLRRFGRDKDAGVAALEVRTGLGAPSEEAEAPEPASGLPTLDEIGRLAKGVGIYALRSASIIDHPVFGVRPSLRRLAVLKGASDALMRDNAALVSSNALSKAKAAAAIAKRGGSAIAIPSGDPLAASMGLFDYVPVEDLAMSPKEIEYHEEQVRKSATGKIFIAVRNEIEEDLEKNFLENLAGGLVAFQEGLIKLTGDLAGVTLTGVPADAGFWKQLEGEIDKGVEVGGGFYSGAIGSTAALATKNPLKTIWSKPIDFALIFLPLFRGLARAGKLAVPADMMATMEALAARVKETKAGQAAAVAGRAAKNAGIGAFVGADFIAPGSAMVIGAALPEAARLLWKGYEKFAPEHQAQLMQGLAQFFVDATKGRTPAETDIIRMATERGEEIRSQVESLAQPAVARIRSGEVPPIEPRPLATVIEPIQPSATKPRQPGVELGPVGPEPPPSAKEFGPPVGPNIHLGPGKKKLTPFETPREPVTIEAVLKDVIDERLLAEGEKLVRAGERDVIPIATRGEFAGRRVGQTAKGEPVPERGVQPRTTDPAFERELDNMYSVSKEMFNDIEMTRERFGVVFTQPLQADSMAMLIDKRFRGSVIRSIAEGLKMEEKAATALFETLDEPLLKIGSDAVKEGRAQMASIKLPSGSEVPVEGIVRHVLEKTEEGRLNSIRANVFQSLANGLAKAAQKSTLITGLEREFTRNADLGAIVEAIANDTGAAPQLTPFSPADMAAAVRARLGVRPPVPPTSVPPTSAPPTVLEVPPRGTGLATKQPGELGFPRVPNAPMGQRASQIEAVAVKTKAPLETKPAPEALPAPDTAPVSTQIAVRPSGIHEDASVVGQPLGDLGRPIGAHPAVRQPGDLGRSVGAQAAVKPSGGPGQPGVPPTPEVPPTQPTAALTVQQEARMRKFLQRIEGGDYVPVKGPGGFAVQDIAKQVAGKLGLSDRALPPFDKAFTTKGFGRAVNEYRKTLDYFEKSNSLSWVDRTLVRLNQRMKRGLVTQNAAAHRRNFDFNVGVQSMRRGQDPVSVWKSLLEENELWSSWRRGKPLSAQDRLMMESGVKANVGSKFGDGELGAVKGNGPKWMEKHAPALLKKLQQAGEFADQTYNFGDVLFKSEEHNIGWRAHTGRLKQLDKGDVYAAQEAGGRTLRVKKVGDAPLDFNASPSSPSPFEMNGKRLTIRQLAEINSRWSAKPGVDLFFDYTKVPIYVAWLRRQHFIGAASPFYTWLWKATDFPGVKKGLVSHIFSADAGTAFTTNNRALLAGQAAANVKLGLRRGFWMEGAKQQADERKEFLKSTLRFFPREEGLMLLGNLTDPRDGTVSYLNFGSQSFSEGVNLLMRMGNAAAVSASPEFNPEKLWKWSEKYQRYDIPDDIPPDQRGRARARQRLWFKNEAGHLWEPADVFELFGLSGGLMMNTYQEFGNKFRLGRSLGPASARAGMGVMRGMLGASVVDAFRLPNEAFEKMRAAGETADVDDIVRQMVRGMVGLGYKKAVFDDKAERYLRNIKRELAASVRAHGGEDSVVGEHVQDIAADEIDKIELELERWSDMLAPAEGGE